MFEKFVNICFTLALGTSFRYLLPSDAPSAYSNNMLHKQGVVISDTPHHVLVVYTNLYCSGSLIGSKTVLTAASCLSLMKRDTKCNVKVGSSTITGMSQIIPVLEVKIHEYYQEVSRMDNDIALLHLRDHVGFGPNVKKIVLAGLDVTLRSGISITVTGWSISKTTQFSNLLWTVMVVMDDTDCKKVYGNLITTSNYCAKQPIVGKSEEQEHQLTDNGGSALFDNLLVGVLSFEGAKKDDQYVAVFTNVSYFHRWIHINTERLHNKHCIESSDYYRHEENEDRG